MMLIAFRSKLTPQAGADYDAMNDEMERLARAHPGFVDVKSYLAEDGERLTLVWWTDEETLHAWAANLRHQHAQRTGRERWYEYYRMEVAEVVRESRFERKHD